MIVDHSSECKELERVFKLLYRENMELLRENHALKIKIKHLEELATQIHEAVTLSPAIANLMGN